VYDNRFRQTSRSATIYEKWKPTSGLSSAVLSLDSTQVSIQGFKGGNIKLIATPYRNGKHFATWPTDFVPIIDQLKELHDADFVHGDIRAYNMVFGERAHETKPPTGWLIDFDFGGKAGEVRYPPGYNGALRDGTRIGRGEELIEKWHDWYSLGHIIFQFHKWKKPSDGLDIQELSLHRLSQTWVETGDHFTDSTIEELKSFLSDFERLKWTVQPTGGFQVDLDRGNPTKIGTRPQATGSPPQK
jgi:hypothetical protein